MINISIIAYQNVPCKLRICVYVTRFKNNVYRGHNIHCVPISRIQFNPIVVNRF